MRGRVLVESARPYLHAAFRTDFDQRRKHRARHACRSKRGCSERITDSPLWSFGQRLFRCLLSRSDRTLDDAGGGVEELTRVDLDVHPLKFGVHRARFVGLQVRDEPLRDLSSLAREEDGRCADPVLRSE